MCRVKWGETFSPWFAITAGVRQGGVLSPDFYCLYVDGLLQQLKQLRKGCHFLGHFAAAFFYADDMCVLSPSIKGLDHLLRVCEKYCAEWDINLNSKKSRNLYFGKRTEISYDIILNGKKVEWTDTWNYLGVMLRSSKQFNCSVTDKIKKFYRCANSILRIDGRSNDMVMLRLIESHCIPLLSYAIEVVHVADRDERRQLRVAYNSVFRKIFCYRWSQSVTMLQTFLKRPTWEQLVEKRKNDFLVRVNKSSADTLARVLMAWHFCHGQMLFINDVFILYFCCCIVSWKLPLYYTNQPSVWIQTNHDKMRRGNRKPLINWEIDKTINQQEL